MLSVFCNSGAHSFHFFQRTVIAVCDNSLSVPVPEILSAFYGTGEFQNALAVGSVK